MYQNFKFTVNEEKSRINVQRTFNAELPLVWDAYTKSELLDQWWAPKPWKTKTKSMDFREGGHWHYAMVGPSGEEHWCWADYKEIEVHKHYAGLDAFADVNGNINKDLPQSDWFVSFVKQEDSTLVEFEISYGDLSQLKATIEMGFREGLAMAMQNLDELLETLK